MAPFFPQQMNAGLQQVGQTASSYLTGGLARGVSEYNSYERSLAATPMASVHRPLYLSFVPSQFKSYGNIQRPQMPVGHSRVYRRIPPISLSPAPNLDLTEFKFLVINGLSQKDFKEIVHLYEAISYDYEI